MPKEGQFRGDPLTVGSPHTVQSHHYESSIPQGSMQPDSDKAAQAAAHLRARNPGQHFIDTHEYLMPTKTGLSALPASPRSASVSTVYVCVRERERPSWEKKAPDPKTCF